MKQHSRGVFRRAWMGFQSRNENHPQLENPFHVVIQGSFCKYFHFVKKLIHSAARSIAGSCIFSQTCKNWWASVSMQILTAKKKQWDTSGSQWQEMNQQQRLKWREEKCQSKVMWQHKRATAEAQGHLNVGTWSLKWSLWSVNHGCFKAAVALNLQLEENQNAIKSFFPESYNSGVTCYRSCVLPSCNAVISEQYDRRQINFCFSEKIYSGNFRTFNRYNEQHQWSVIIILYVGIKNL